MNDENLEPDEGREAGPGEDEVSTDENSGAARISELTAELENLRAESSAQLEALRTENARQLEAFCTLARTLPGVVPELVGGTSLEVAQASVETAREAYSRVAANLTPVEVVVGLGAGGGVRNGYPAGEDQPAKLSSERGVNLIYQAIASGKSGNLAR